MLSTFFHFATIYPVENAVQFSDEQIALGNAIVLFVFAILPIIILLVYAITSFLLAKIFTKVGLPSWKAWIPLYNVWKTLEIGGQNGLWTILLLIPFANIIAVVFMIMTYYTIGKRLGKPGTFVLWAIFLPIIWLLILGLDSSVWHDESGKPIAIPQTTPKPIA